MRNLFKDRLEKYNQEIMWVLRVGYDDLFDDSPRTVAEYLDGVPKQGVLISMAGLLARLDHGFKEEDQLRVIFEMWLSRADLSIVYQVKNAYSKLKRECSNVSFLSDAACLELIEYAFEHLEDGPEVFTPEQEVALFKAYLVCNQSINQREQSIEGLMQADDKVSIAKATITTQLPCWELGNRNNKQHIVTQLIKAVYLFQFLESTPDTLRLLQLFLAQEQVDSWQAYYHKLLPVPILLLKEDTRGHTDIAVPGGEAFEEVCKYLDKYCVDTDASFEEEDYTALRRTPMYKVEPGLYRPIFKPFAIDKIFRTIYFDLAALVRNNRSSLPGPIREFRSYYGTHFSERYLFYKILDGLFSRDFVKFTGEELEGVYRMQGAPDFYARQKSKLFLFECKDPLLDKAVKHSYDPVKIEQKLSQILRYNAGENKKKAVQQLANSVSNLFNGLYTFDGGCNLDQVVVYPIIVVHDEVFNVPGINVLVQDWFKQELSTFPNLPTHLIRPLVIVDINTLILLKEATKKGRITLKETLTQYYDQILNSTNPHRRNISFGNFIRNFMEEKRLLVTPAELLSLPATLFPAEST
jgi:hypothetical protein